MHGVDRVISAIHPAGFPGQTLGKLLDLLASGLLVPGGGSAAGIGGALGVSLLEMVATLPARAAMPSPQSDELRSVIARLRPARDRLVHLAELDVEAYARVIDARRTVALHGAARAADANLSRSRTKSTSHA